MAGPSPPPPGPPPFRAAPLPPGPLPFCAAPLASGALPFRAEASEDGDDGPYHDDADHISIDTGAAEGLAGDAGPADHARRDAAQRVEAHVEHRGVQDMNCAGTCLTHACGGRCCLTYGHRYSHLCAGCWMIDTDVARYHERLSSRAPPPHPGPPPFPRLASALLLWPQARFSAAPKLLKLRMLKPLRHSTRRSTDATQGAGVSSTPRT